MSRSRLSRKKMVIHALALILIGLLWASPSEATPCTDGVDCYCDKVKGGSLNDPLLLFCEDFEITSLRNNVAVGGGAPNYGPWYDATGQTGNRGINSWWQHIYGNGSAGLFTSGQPANPTFGAPCGFSLCSGLKVWDATNRWGGNAYEPNIAIYTQSSDFSNEIPSLTPPTHAAGGGSGVFDGTANMVHRIPPGNTSTILGDATFTPGQRNIGLTMALAYPANINSSGVFGPSDGSLNASWKHNEWGTVLTDIGLDGIFVFYNQQPRSTFPFAGFMGSYLNQNDTNCGSAVVSVGSTSCVGGGLGINWAAGNYNQATDWPFGGGWGCVRGFLENAGLSNQRMRIWFQGPNMTSERLILDFTVNATLLDNKLGYKKMAWNSYANTNSGTGYILSTQTTFRYEDNVHARAGTPVSCAQIGFSGTAPDTTPPAAPTGVTISRTLDPANLHLTGSR